MECLNCKKDVQQTPKKRPKLYCSEKCRIEYFRKKKAENEPKNGRGRPRKNQLDKAIIGNIKSVKPEIDHKLANYVPSPLEPIVEATNKAMEAKGLTALFISKPEKVKASDIFDFPKGWESMGKIERLQWLTEHRR